MTSRASERTLRPEDAKVFEALDPAATALVAADAQHPMGAAAGSSARQAASKRWGQRSMPLRSPLGNIGAIALSGALKIWIAAAC